MNLRQLALVAATAIVAVGTAATQVVAQSPNAPATPPPLPGPNASATPGTVIGTPSPATAPPIAAPTPTAAPRGRRGRGPAATPSPEASASASPAPQFQSLDGVWEVEVQPLDSSGRTVYSHLYVTQIGDNVSGTWARPNSKQRIPFSGTFDGRLFTFTAKDGATTYTMSGYAENFSDMVGLLKSSNSKDQGTPFTAEHRKKEKIGVGVQ